MGFFDIFKKKKQIDTAKLSKEDKQWDKIWDLWVEGKIESPYAELMEYLNGVNNGGHYCHFDNISGNRDLKEYVDALIRILPKPLNDNVELAYKAYIINPDDMSDENNDILDSCDSTYYKNEDIVNNIIKERASKIEV